MGRTYTDFSQLSKGMFRKSEPVVEVKPIPKEASAGGDDALAYFGLTGSGKREGGRAGTVGGCDASGAGAGKDACAALKAPQPPSGASDVKAGNDASAALEARVGAAEAQIAAIGAERDAAERRAADLEAQLKREHDARLAAEAERDRLRDEVIRLRNELLR